MTVEEAIKHFESLQKRYTTQHNGKQCEFVETALEALRRAQPENEPLTLSQLYDIDNEPLYFHCTVGIWSLNGWHIVKAINYDGAQFKDVQLDNNDAHIESLYNYGITWFAYRHKPEKEYNDA